MIELMQEVRKLQNRLGVEFRLRGFVKSELLTKEQADAMRNAGFRWLLVGFESGSDQILKAMNKKATRDDNSRCMDIARNAGLKVKALMSVGHPGESPDTVKETTDWLLEQRPDDLDVTVVSVYPGSPYFDFAKETKQGIWTYETPHGVLHQLDVDYETTADFYKGDPNGGNQSMVFTPSLTTLEVVAVRDAADTEVRTKLGIASPTRSVVDGWKYDGKLTSIMRNTQGEHV
jgi:anaerobic magnesium-protoporphyrin IX monomethyl ester cyclase